MEEESRNTLLPVLAVIGIIVLLVAIRLASRPGLIGGDHRRSRTARAKSEIRNLAVNLETYYIDHKTYPPAVDQKGNYIPLGTITPGVSAGYVPHALTTPISYTASLPFDPFHTLRRKKNGPYRYATNGESCWILLSNGPDEDTDIQAENYPSPGAGKCSWKQFMNHFGVGTAIEYDATNGTKSSGDIVRVGP